MSRTLPFPRSRSRMVHAERSMELDPVRDHREVLLGVAAHDYPWDTVQALSFALFRTYAVPSIGGLLDRTGEFTGRVQKRYDDTGLLLEEIQRHGLESSRGRDAVRRINQMHAMHDISDADMRYVLATFVVVPKRWIDDHGFRPLTPHEVIASVHYYRELGRHMAIPDLPEDFAGFERLLDAYEQEHFAPDPGGRRVADATLDLMTTFPPHHLLPRRVVRRAAYALMDEPLLDAFGYPHPTRLERRLVRGGLRLRARVLALLPARTEPRWASDLGWFRSYPGGYAISALGTFRGPTGAPRPGCPVGRGAAPEGQQPAAS
ncbi:hypothetical protein SAMN04488570_2990 [Nocardioides scoriae]|uniref:ER-bound oxygenase mpaB/mpaB'/Rubber oxygenase catalytic domain-containing protein n=1 Tax=Nocardioides scoriae TaxID=642780 RepID=A0A1H1VZQ4_9ACTN|nr:oxygenase MpaB family protein [Nocardioides scoriae]SDS90225.1 hypothetical protein SAMN04488570_2990 [Nocardioides scoriae]